MEAAKRLSEEVASAQQHVEVATTKVAADADDEGFFDKNVASPSSVGDGASSSARSDVCSGASESGTTSPPPNVEEEEEEEEEEDMMEEVR